MQHRINNQINRNGTKEIDSTVCGGEANGETDRQSRQVARTREGSAAVAQIKGARHIVDDEEAVGHEAKAQRRRRQRRAAAPGRRHDVDDVLLAQHGARPAVSCARRYELYQLLDSKQTRHLPIDDGLFACEM